MSTHDVKSLIDGIAQLSQQDLPAADFYGQVLGRLDPFLQGAPTAVWLWGGAGPDLLCHHKMDGEALTNGHLAEAPHLRLLSAVQEGGQPRLYHPHSGDEGGAGVNPTDFLLGVCPVKVGENVVALMESFQEVNGHPERNEAALRLLTIVAGVATSFHRNLELNWRRKLDKFSFAVHKTLDPIRTAFAIANDGKNAVGCDRLSVVFKKGGRCRIEAVSGMESVHRRSNQVRLLQNVAKKVLATGESFTYPDPTVELPPQLEQAVQDYVDESQTRFLSLIPLVKTDQKIEEGDEQQTPKKDEIVGAVIAERFSGEPFTTDRVESVAQHSSRALSNAMQHHRVFLLPLWTAIGNLSWLVQARTLPKTLVVTALIIAALAVLTFVQKDFTMNATGTLEPEDRRLVFAPSVGTIVRVHDKFKTEPGADGENRFTVTHADTLAYMESIEMELQAEKVRGQILAAEAELKNLEIKMRDELRAGQQRSPTDKIQDRARKAELVKIQENLAEQYALHDKLVKSLEVRCPLDKNDADREWTVISWDVENLLKDRPVSRGQELMTVADLNGEWVLELLLPDKSMGHFLAAQDELGDDLVVTFYLATNPQHQMTGRVKDYARSARADEEEGLTVRVTVAVDKNEIPDLHPGAEVEAKIHAPKASIGYCWLHPVFEFIQRKVIFPYF